MSKDIDTSNGVEGLSDDDLLYLAQRDNQDAIRELENRNASLDQSADRPLEQVPNTGDANTRGETIEELEARLARMRAEQEAAEADDAEDDEDLDYNSMSNDELRAELARRDLSVQGNKAELIQRLEEDDASEEDDEEEE